MAASSFAPSGATLETYISEFKALTLEPSHTLYQLENKRHTVNHYVRLARMWFSQESYWSAFLWLGIAYDLHNYASEAEKWISRSAEHWIPRNTASICHPWIFAIDVHLGVYETKKNLTRALTILKKNEDFLLKGKEISLGKRELHDRIQKLAKTKFTSRDEFFAVFEACKMLYDNHPSRDTTLAKAQLQEIPFPRFSEYYPPDLSLRRFFNWQYAVINPSQANLDIARESLKADHTNDNLQILLDLYPFPNKTEYKQAIQSDHVAALYRRAIDLSSSKPKEAACFYLKIFILLASSSSHPALPQGIRDRLCATIREFISHMAKSKNFDEQVFAAFIQQQMDSRFLVEEIWKTKLDEKINSDKIICILTRLNSNKDALVHWSKYCTRIGRGKTGYQVIDEYKTIGKSPAFTAAMVKVKQHVINFMIEDNKPYSKEMLLAAQQIIIFDAMKVFAEMKEPYPEANVHLINSDFILVFKLMQMRGTVEDSSHQLNEWIGLMWGRGPYWSYQFIVQPLKEAFSSLYKKNPTGASHSETYRQFKELINTTQTKCPKSHLLVTMFREWAATVCGNNPLATQEDVRESIGYCAEIFSIIKELETWPVLLCMKNLGQQVMRLRNDSLTRDYVEHFKQFDREGKLAGEIAKYSIEEKKPATATTAMSTATIAATLTATTAAMPTTTTAVLTATTAATPTATTAATPTATTAAMPTTTTAAIPTGTTAAVPTTTAATPTATTAPVLTARTTHSAAEEKKVPALSASSGLYPDITPESSFPTPSAPPPELLITTVPSIAAPVSIAATTRTTAIVSSTSEGVATTTTVEPEDTLSPPLQVESSSSSNPRPPSYVPLANASSEGEEALYDYVSLSSAALPPSTAMAITAAPPAELLNSDMPYFVPVEEGKPSLPTAFAVQVFVSERKETLATHALEMKNLYDRHERSNLPAYKEFIYMQLLYHVLVNHNLHAFDFLTRIVYKQSNIPLLQLYNKEILLMLRGKSTTKATIENDSYFAVTDTSKVIQYASNNVDLLYRLVLKNPQHDIRILAYHHLVIHALAKKDVEACRLLADIAYQQNRVDLGMFFTQAAKDHLLSDTPVPCSPMEILRLRC